MNGKTTYIHRSQDAVVFVFRTDSVILAKKAKCMNACVKIYNATVNEPYQYTRPNHDRFRHENAKWNSTNLGLRVQYSK